MITRIQVKNFRSIASADVTLGPLTVLVGRNGAGKSAFVDVLRFVRDALQHNLEYAFSKRQGIASLRRWSSNRPYDMEISLTVQTEGLHAEYGFVVASIGRQNQFRVKREYFHLLGEHSKYAGYSYETRNGEWYKEPDNVFADLLHLPQDARVATDKSVHPPRVPVETSELVFPIFVPINRYFRRLKEGVAGNTYSLFPNTLRLPQTLSNEQELAEDGTNLGSVLQTIQKNGEFFPDLQASLRQVIDGVQGVRVKPAGGYLFIEMQHGDLIGAGANHEAAEEAAPSKNGAATAKKRSTTAPWLGLEQESDGTLRMLAMLTALYQQGPSAMLTLEEPEISLHPGALAVLSDVIKEAALRRQIIITTQSPDLISRFQPDELRVVERIDGATQIGPLDSLQKQVVVDELFKGGDLLRIQGLRREPSAVK